MSSADNTLYAPKLERAVLAGVFENPEASRELVDVLRSNLTSEDFGASAHALIFAAMCRQAAAGQSVDTVSVAEELQRMGKLAEVGGPAYLSSLGDGVIPPHVIVTAERVATWCQGLRDRTLRRQAISIAKEIQSAAQRLDAPIAEVLGSGVGKLARVRIRGNKLRTLRAIKDQVQKEIEDRDDGKLEPAVRTGFQRLDQLTGGLPHSLTILAAMGGVGKSAFIASLALRVAYGASRFDGTRAPGVPVGILSLEDPAKWVGYRLLSAESGIRSHRLRHAKFSTEEWDAFGAALKALEDFDERVIIDDRQRLTAGEVVQTAREMVVVHGCKLVIVDNATAVRFPRVREEKKTEAIEEWLGDLREIGTSHGAAVMSVHHVKRREGLTPKQLPLLTDVKDSSSAENLARLMMLASREPGSNLFRLGIPKQTDGDAGDVIDFFFDQEAQMVRDRTARDEAENTPEGFPIGSERAKASSRPRKRKTDEGFVAEPEKDEESKRE